MATNIDPAITSTIVAAVVFRGEGVVLADIVTAFPTPQERSKVQQWVDALVAAGLVEKDASVTPHRYYPRQATVDYYRAAAAGGRTSNIERPTSNVERETKDQTAADGGGTSNIQHSTSNGSGDGLTTQVEPVIKDIVLHIMVRASAVAFLQQAAAGAVPEGQRAAFVQYGLDRLSHLTLGDCSRLGIEPSQYEIWRRQYFPPAEASVPQPKEPAAETDESKKRPTSGANGAGEGTPTRSKGRGTPEPDPIDELLTPILNAVTRTSASGSSPSFPAGSSRVQTALPAPELRTATKGLIDLVGRFAPVNPTVRVILGVAVAPVLGWLVYVVGRSPWVGGLLGAAVVAGLMLWPRVAAARPHEAAGLNVGRDLPIPPTGRRGAETPPYIDPQTRRGTETPPYIDPQAQRGTETDPQTRRIGRRWPVILMAVGVMVVLVGTAIAVWWYQRNVQRPPQAALRTYLVASAAPLPVRVVGVDITYGKVDGTGCPLTYQVLFETTEPLYRRLDAAEYLRAHHPAELAAIEAAQAILRGPDGGRIAAAVVDRRLPTEQQGLGTVPLLVTTQTPPGAGALGTGKLTAWRRDGAWVFTGNPMQLDRRALAGDPKPAGALAVDLPADAARLSAMLAEQAAYAGKVQAAAATAAAVRERERQARAATLGQMLRAGTLFTGSITDPFRGGNQPIVLEVTSTSPGPQKLTAVLRNDGGWSDTRAFSGEWTITPDADGAVATLRTPRGDAVDGAGPLLQDRWDWSISFRLNSDGSVTAPADSSTTRTSLSVVAAGLRRVDPADAAAVKADVLRPLAPALAATRAGVVYRGTVTSRVYRTSEVLLLRFLAAEDSDGGIGRSRPTPGYSPSATSPYDESLRVRATLESTTATGGVRPFEGVIVSNRYRAGTSPLRLRSSDAERVARANAWSLLGFDSTNNGLELALRVTGDRLVGENAWFTYEFAPDGANSNLKSQISDSKDGGLPVVSAPVDPLAETAALEPGIAYARIAGRWVALPHNNGHELKKVVQIINGWFDKLKAIEAKAAGKEPEPSKDIVGELVFDGTDPVPALPGADVLIVYVGGITPRSQKEVAAYPILLLEPPIELSPMQVLPTRERYTLLSQLVPGVRNFGPRRVDVVIEQPRPTLTIVRPRAPLPPGPYAVECNGQVFEFLVQ